MGFRRVAELRRSSHSTPQAESHQTVATFASLRFHNYRLFFFGQSISVGGNWMQNIAIGWFVLELSHSGTVLGMVTAARFLPLVLLGPWGGVVSDRMDNRRLLTATQTTSALLSFVLAGTAWAGVLNIPLLFVLVILLGLVNVFDNPSRQSLISELVGREYLANAIALNSTSINFARVFGPALGGALIAGLGVSLCFFVNAISYVAVIVSLVVMRADEIISAERAVRSKGQIVAGLRYIRDTPELLRPLTMVAVTGILTWEFPVSLPLLTTGTFHRGASGYGAAMACLGVGSVFGGLIAARRTRLTVRSLALSSTLWGLAIVAAALAPTLPLAFVALVFVGSGSITFNASAKTLLQLESVPAMRGRVMSIWFIAWQGSAVVGAPIVGFVGATLGPRSGLLIGGIAAIAVGVPLIGRRFAQLRDVEALGAAQELPDK